MKSRSTSSKATRLRDQHKVSVEDTGRRSRPSYTATQAKNEFGRVLEQAIHGTPVVITKHNSARAILISVDQFIALEQAPQMELNTLTEQFDDLLARMQTRTARRGMAAAFNASTKRLGKIAVVAARKRG